VLLVVLLLLLCCLCCCLWLGWQGEPQMFASASGEATSLSRPFAEWAALLERRRPGGARASGARPRRRPAAPSRA
jgi:hypothetical protein